MVRKNVALKLGGLVLIMALITTSLVCGTYSKFTKQVSGSDMARIAKFAFDLKDGTNTLTEQTVNGSYNIFNYTDTGVFANGVNSTKYIAPGTTGVLNLELDNLSEVKVAATFALTETNSSSIPVYYTYGNGTQRYSSVLTGTYTGGTYKTLADLSTDMAAVGSSIAASDGSTPQKANYAIHWAWSFDSAGGQQTDSGDTALGVSYTSPASISLAIATTVTQQDL